MGECCCNHTQTAFLFIQVAHRPSLCMAPSLHFEWSFLLSCTYSNGHLHEFRDLMVAMLMAGKKKKGCIGKDFKNLFKKNKQTRRFLKELSPYYASMHPKNSD